MNQFRITRLYTVVLVKRLPMEENSRRVYVVAADSVTEAVSCAQAVLTRRLAEEVEQEQNLMLSGSVRPPENIFDWAVYSVQEQDGDYEVVVA